MSSGAGMSRSEHTAYSIAKHFFKAVQRLEDFQDDPELVYDSLDMVTFGADPKVKETMRELTAMLRGSVER